MSRHAIRSFTWMLLAIVLNGCLSLSYHAKELSNRARPCLFPGFMYYLRGTDKNFWDAYLDELRTNIPLGAFLPVFMLVDLCVDVVFLPLDGVLVATSDSDYIMESSKGGECGLQLPKKQVLEQYSVYKALALEIDVGEGTCLVKAGRWPEDRLDMYFPEKHEILVSGNCEEDGHSGHIKLLLYPPVFRCMGGDDNWSFKVIEGNAEALPRMSFIGMFFSNDFKGVIRLVNAGSNGQKKGQEIKTEGRNLLIR